MSPASGNLHVMRSWLAGWQVFALHGLGRCRCLSVVPIVRARKWARRTSRGKADLVRKLGTWVLTTRCCPKFEGTHVFCSKSLGLCSCEKLPDLDWQIPHLYWFWPGGLSLRHLQATSLVLGIGAGAMIIHGHCLMVVGTA